MGLADEMRNSRDRLARTGDVLMEEQRRRGEADAGRAGRYRDWGEQEATRLMESGGYTPEELARILGDDRLDRISLGTDYSGYGLSDEDVRAMYGDESSRYRYMGEWDKANEEQDAYARNVRGTTNRLREDLDASVTADLGLDPEFAGNIYRDLDKSDAESRAAINKDELTQSKDFVDRYRMSPEERNRIEAVGGLAVRDRANADIAAAERSAAASGTGALGASALRNRVSRSAGVDAADALTRGKLYASDAAAGREKDIESMRVDSAGRYADLASRNAMQRGDRRVGARTTVEGMRLDSARDVSDRRGNNARTSAGATLDGERDIQSSATGTRQYFTNLGTQIATGIDQENRQTASNVAHNRQQTARDINDDRYRRDTYADSARTQRGAGAADARREDNREGRQWLNTQHQTYNQNDQNEQNRRLQTYGIQTGGVNDANRNVTAAANQPKWWERLAGAAIGAAGAAFGAGGAFSRGGRGGNN